jgi:hypothetical protein
MINLTLAANYATGKIRDPHVLAQVIVAIGWKVSANAFLNHLPIVNAVSQGKTCIPV